MCNCHAHRQKKGLFPKVVLQINYPGNSQEGEAGGRGDSGEAPKRRKYLIWDLDFTGIGAGESISDGSGNDIGKRRGHIDALSRSGWLKQRWRMRLKGELDQMVGGLSWQGAESH